METQDHKSEGNTRRDFFKKAGTGLAVGAVVATGTAGVVCAMNSPEKPKVEGFIGRAVRKVKQTIAPTQATVRFDGSVGMWAVLDKDLRPVRHFQNGVMTGVHFRSERVTKRVPGCGGGSTTEFAGIAEGLLKENSYGSENVGFRNLKFKNGSFVTYNEQEIRETPVLVLLPERHAIYKEITA